MLKVKKKKHTSIDNKTIISPGKEGKQWFSENNDLQILLG